MSVEKIDAAPMVHQRNPPNLARSALVHKLRAVVAAHVERKAVNISHVVGRLQLQDEFKGTTHGAFATPYW